MSLRPFARVIAAGFGRSGDTTSMIWSQKRPNVTAMKVVSVIAATRSSASASSGKLLHDELENEQNLVARSDGSGEKDGWKICRDPRTCSREL